MKIIAILFYAKIKAGQEKFAPLSIAVTLNIKLNFKEIKKTVAF